MATLDARAVGSATTSAPSAGAYLILGAGAAGAAHASGSAEGVVVAGVLVTQVGLGLDVGGTTPVAVTQVGIGMDSQRVVPADVTQVAANIDVLRIVPVDDTQVAMGLDVDRIVPVNVTQLLLQIDALGRRNLTSTYCWEFHVYDRAGGYLALLDNAYNKSFLSELNDCGGGQFSIHADDPKATSTNIAVGNLVTIRYANIDIGTWVMEDIEEVLVGDGENVDKIITVSGRGALGLLEDGIVYPSNTADPNTSERAFSAVPKAEIFLTLWNEFQARGGGDLTEDFTKTTDTDGVAWTDSATMSVKAGQTMLDVMRELAALGIDFTVSPDRTLSCRATEGSDKSSSVAFRHGHNIIGCQRKTMGANVTNAVLGEGQGVFVVSTDATSISARGRREAYVAVRNTANSTQVGDANAVVINSYKDPPTSIQIAVLDNGVYPFITYDLGDTVHVDIPGEINADYRLLAITMKERTGPCDLAIVLELNSLEAEWLIRVNRALQASLQTVQPGAGSGAGVASTDASPTVTASGGGMGTASIKSYHIAWGTAVNQVSAADIPIADAGAFYAGTTVEAALQEVYAALGTVGGNVAADTIWDAKGDLAVGTASNAATRLAVGTVDGQVLTIDSGEATGLKWAAVVAAGTITVANDTLWDAKGDLAVGTASNAAAILPVGTVDGQVLTVDSSAATGLKWAAAAVGTAGGVVALQEVDGAPAIGTVTTIIVPNTTLTASGGTATLAWALPTHTHTESDISDLDHDAVKLQGRAIGTTSPSDGQVLKWSTAGTAWEPAADATSAGAATEAGILGFTLHGGGTTLTTGLKGWVPVPRAGTVTKWEVVADQAGDLVVDIWADDFASFPPTDLDSMTGSDLPRLSGAATGASTALTGWTAALTAGDWLAFNVDSVGTVTQAVVSLYVTWEA